jgi:hypothetical protein
MDKYGKRELAIVLGIFTVFILFLVPALIYSRRAERDQVRIQELIEHKIDLEIYFNKYDSYPLQLDVFPHEYVVIKETNNDATAWYLRTQLENRLPLKAGFNDTSGHNHYFRIIEDGTMTFYDICGGTFICGVVPEK